MKNRHATEARELAARCGALYRLAKNAARKGSSGNLSLQDWHAAWRPAESGRVHLVLTHDGELRGEARQDVIAVLGIPGIPVHKIEDTGDSTEFHILLFRGDDRLPVQVREGTDEAGEPTRILDRPFDYFALGALLARAEARAEAEGLF